MSAILFLGAENLSEREIEYYLSIDHDPATMQAIVGMAACNG